MTHDTWWKVNILTKFQVPSFHADTHLSSDRGDTCSTFETGSYKQQDWEEKDHLVTESVSHNGVCRTSQATPGLLNISKTQFDKFLKTNK